MACFIELTNPVHGGYGWEFGQYLWSPTDSAWNIVRKPRKGDVIIHSLKKGEPHRFWGISIVKESYFITETPPPIPDKWNDRDSYYKIPLVSYQEFEDRKTQKTFFEIYKTELKNISPQKSFYNDTGEFKTSQKYLAAVSNELFELLDDYLDIPDEYKNNDYVEEAINKEHEIDIKTKNFNGILERVEVTIQRIVRDSKLVRELKLLYEDTCQICGAKINLLSNKSYSEGHHMQPLGGVHQGVDIAENIIILCPNHHAEFDYGVMAIDPTSGLIIHHDRSNPYHAKTLFYERSNLGKEYIKYHYNNIFEVT